jgi:hypothetical protein
MAKQNSKKPDRRPARTRYKADGHEMANKERNKLKEALRVDWYKHRNALMKNYGLNRTLGKRAALLTDKGFDPADAVAEVRKQAAKA